VKWFFVILLLGNAVFFGWSYRNVLLQDELNAVHGLAVEQPPEKLLLLSELPLPPPSLAANGLPEGAAAPGRAEDSPRSGPDLDESVAVADERPPEWPAEWRNAPEGGEDACLSFGPFFEESRANRLQTWLNERDVRNRRHVEKPKERPYYWIYMAPRKSLAALAETIDDLKEKGIGNYRLIRRGNLKNALSLGVFSDRSEVERRLEELREQGYRPIIVPYGGKQPATWVYARFGEKARSDSGFLSGAPLSRGEETVIECDATELP